MSTLTFFHWLAQTTIAIYMRDSTWGFAIVEIFHLLSLAVFGGAVLFVDLRILDFAFVTQPASRVVREFLPFTIGGIVAMFISGSLLLASGPMRYYYNTAFRIKIWLFFIALVFHFTLQARVARDKSDRRNSAIWRKSAAVTSLLLWISIGLAGRAIGYF